MILPALLVFCASALAPAADTVYIGGLTAPGGNAAEQSRRVLRRLDASLKAAKLSRANVVSVNLYLSDLRLLDSVETAYQAYFRGGLPARTVLQAALEPPGASVCISAVAWRGPVKRFSQHQANLAGDTLYLPDGVPTAGTTIQDQVHGIMSAQEEVLKSAGLSFADLVFTRIYLANPADYAGLNEVYRKFVTAPPPARATVGGFPLAPGTLVQFQSVAVRGSGVGRPSGEGHTSPIHSFAVKASRRLFVTGMTGRTPDGKLAWNDIRDQTRQALQTIEQQLSRHGMTFEDVVDSVVWLRDMRHAPQMDAVYRESAPKPHPRTVVGIPPTSWNALVEIMVTAER